MKITLYILKEIKYNLQYNKTCKNKFIFVNFMNFFKWSWLLNLLSDYQLNKYFISCKILNNSSCLFDLNPEYFF